MTHSKRWQGECKECGNYRRLVGYGRGPECFNCRNPPAKGKRLPKCNPVRTIKQLFGDLPVRPISSIPKKPKADFPTTLLLRWLMDL